MKIFRRATVILACGLLSACQDLDLDDPNRPSLDESLGSVLNLETSVNTASRYWLGGVVMGQSLNFRNAIGEATFAPAIQGLNDELTFGARISSLPATDVIDEPRAEVDHRGTDWNVNRAPYSDAYTAIASCHDVRMTIAGGFKFQVFPGYRRSNYFCKMIMGLSHLYLGVMFDKAIIVPDDFQPIDITNRTFVAHDSVVEFAKTLIREGITESMDTTSTTATGWFQGVTYTNVDMAKIAFGYLARAEVWKATTPDQRKDITQGGVVNWNKVIQYVDSSLSSTWTIGTASATMSTTNVTGGMTGANFVVKGSASVTQSRNAALYNLMYSANNNYFRVHHKLLGPADTTGAYAAYLKTPIANRHDTTYASPDKRLPRGPFLGGATYLQRHISIQNSNFIENALPGDGNYFQLIAGTGTGALPLTGNGLPAPGNRQASYQFIRFGATTASPNIPRRSINSSSSVVYTDWQSVMSPEELQLLKAEAYIRLGNPAAAVTIINATRTAATKGALPAVGVNGPTQPFPQCVPHSFTNAETCGNLMDAMLWEKRMESLGTDMFVNWADWRSFGYLDTGSLVYFPPSFRETNAMGYPYYTYGGSLPGSANATAKCGTGTWQSIGCVDYTGVSRLPKPPQ